MPCDAHPVLEKVVDAKGDTFYQCPECGVIYTLPAKKIVTINPEPEKAEAASAE